MISRVFTDFAHKFVQSCEDDANRFTLLLPQLYVGKLWKAIGNECEDGFLHAQTTYLS